MAEMSKRAIDRTEAPILAKAEAKLQEGIDAKLARVEKRCQHVFGSFFPQHLTPAKSSRKPKDRVVSTPEQSRLQRLVSHRKAVADSKRKARRKKDDSAKEVDQMLMEGDRSSMIVWIASGALASTSTYVTELEVRQHRVHMLVGWLAVFYSACHVLSIAVCLYICRHNECLSKYKKQ